ncbi:transposase, partial [Anoxybacillus sp. J5B_2022]|nr:transposase [Anoxybacillus sp. J5B_2022]
ELIISYEKKALEKGREEGIKQGIKQGMRQGMKHLVQTMAGKGMSVQDIANVTDLAEEEVKQLLKEE